MIINTLYIKNNGVDAHGVGGKTSTKALIFQSHNFFKPY